MFVRVNKHIHLNLSSYQSSSDFSSFLFMIITGTEIGKVTVTAAIKPVNAATAPTFSAVSLTKCPEY